MLYMLYIICVTILYVCTCVYVSIYIYKYKYLFLQVMAEFFILLLYFSDTTGRDVCAVVSEPSGKEHGYWLEVRLFRESDYSFITY